jgi:hypothetical protein
MLVVPPAKRVLAARLEQNLTLWSEVDCDRQLNDSGGLKSGQRLQCAEST